MKRYINLYKEKWMEYLIENNIDEEDEKRYTWGWQFEEEDFINSAELLLGCYLSNYSCIGEAIECLHLIDSKDYYYDLAQKALELIK